MVVRLFHGVSAVSRYFQGASGGFKGVSETFHDVSGGSGAFQTVPEWCYRDLRGVPRGFLCIPLDFKGFPGHSRRIPEDSNAFCERFGGFREVPGVFQGCSRQLQEATGVSGLFRGFQGDSEVQSFRSIPRGSRRFEECSKTKSFRGCFMEY